VFYKTNEKKTGIQNL